MARALARACRSRAALSRLRIVVAKSFARIHQQNLVNYGILPLLFVDPTDYDRLEMNDTLRVRDCAKSSKAGGESCWRRA